MSHHHHRAPKPLTPEQQRTKAGILEFGRLRNEATQAINEKIAAKEINPKDEHAKSNFTGQYIREHAQTPYLRQFLKLPSLAGTPQNAPPVQVQTVPNAQYNAQAAQRHVRRRHHHKHANSFWRKVFHVVKIVAIGATAFVTAPLGGPIIAAAACAVTDAAIQKIGVETGCQDKFSLTEVIETGVSAGVGSTAAVAAAGVVPKAMTVAASAAITEATEAQLGLRDDLDPAAILTQGAASVVSSVINKAMPAVNDALDKTFPNTVNAIGKDNVVLTTTSVTNTAATSAVQSVISNQSMNLESVLMNTLGSGLASKVGIVLNQAIDNINAGIPEFEDTGSPKTENANDGVYIGDMCTIDENQNQEIQLPTNEEMHEFLGMVEQTLERLNLPEEVDANPNGTILNVGGNNQDQNDANKTLLPDESHSLASEPTDGINVIPPVIVEAPRTTEAVSFFDSLSTWQKVGLTTGVVLGAVALLPEELGAALLIGLGRLGTALLPGVGPLSEAIVLDGAAGEAIGVATSTVAISKVGATIGNALSKMGGTASDLMSKFGLFKLEIASALKADAKIISTEQEFYTKATYLSEHDFYKPGLADHVKDNFIGNSYKTYILEKDITLFRAGSNEKSLGEYFSFEKPVSELQVRIDKAIRHFWENSGGISVVETGYAIKIPKGTIIHVGEISPQGGVFLGGTKQIFIQTPWEIPGVEIIEKFPLQEELLWNQIAKASIR